MVSVVAGLLIRKSAAASRPGEKAYIVVWDASNPEAIFLIATDCTISTLSCTVEPARMTAFIRPEDALQVSAKGLRPWRIYFGISVDWLAAQSHALPSLIQVSVNLP